MALSVVQANPTSTVKVTTNPYGPIMPRGPALTSGGLTPTSYGSVGPILQGSSPSLQGSQPYLQPASSGIQLQPAVTAPMLQPTVTTSRLQPAATAQQIQPAATTPMLQPAVGAQVLQPAVGGLPALPSPTGSTTPSGQTFGFMDGSKYDMGGNQIQTPQAPQTTQAQQGGFSFMDGSGFTGSGQYTPPPAYTPQPAQPAQPPTQPTSPAFNPPPPPAPVDTSRLSELEKLVQSLYEKSPEEIAAEIELIKQNEAYLMGSENVRNKTIAMPFITGQLESLDRMNALKQIPLNQQLALQQAKRQSALDASKFTLTREDARIEREYGAQADERKYQRDLFLKQLDYQHDRSKPVSVAPGGTLVDPTTGQSIYASPALGNYQMQIDPLTGQPYVLNQRTGELGGTSGSGMRTDRHNNPTAFTTDIAKQAGLVEGRDYIAGDPFPDNPNLKTAKLLGDPIQTTISVIDRLGFYTQSGQPRWSYINQIPEAQNWNNLSQDQKAQVVQKMYQFEGGNGQLGQQDPTTYYGQQVQQNPQVFNELSEQAQKLAQEYFRRSGQSFPANTKPPTDTQNQSATYALRIQQSSSILDQLESSIANYNPAGFEAQLRLPNFAKSDQIQSYEQASRNFINSVLRRESGAVISPSEFENAYRQYLPRAGDSQQVLEQKRTNRQTVMQGFISGAGSAWNNLTGGQQSNNNNPLDLAI